MIACVSLWILGACGSFDEFGFKRLRPPRGYARPPHPLQPTPRARCGQLGRRRHEHATDSMKQTWRQLTASCQIWWPRGACTRSRDQAARARRTTTPTAVETGPVPPSRAPQLESRRQASRFQKTLVSQVRGGGAWAPSSHATAHASRLPAHSIQHPLRIAKRLCFQVHRWRACLGTSWSSWWPGCTAGWGGCCNGCWTGFQVWRLLRASHPLRRMPSRQQQARTPAHSRYPCLRTCSAGRCRHRRRQAALL